MIDTMNSSTGKTNHLQIVFYQRVPSPDCEWRDNSDWSAVDSLITTLEEEFKSFYILIQQTVEQTEIVVRGYADILNSIRLRYPAGGFSNTCLGHVIGCSSNRNIAEDLKRGINRILFAPETIEPQGSDKIVCHNCGCGC